MREIVGDLWMHLGSAVVAITTGGGVDRKGQAVMLRGTARQARQLDPALPQRLGQLLVAKGNHVHELGGGLVSFPVEEGPFQVPDLSLIERSCRELVALASDRGWGRVVIPRPGCGGGGLSWSEVKPVLVRHFDHRFLVISPEEPPAQ